jgi:putative glutamine amidotransferase
MSSHSPVIAIVPNRKPADYVTSIERAGARTLVIDRTRNAARDVLDDVAGLLLTGGGDVDPARYGEAVDPHFEAAEDGRDEYETEIIRLALARDLPLLAICRGVQILNVALGGSLIQDIPSQHPSGVNHSITEPKWALAHDVSVARDSLLHAALRDRISDAGTLPVNSRHHQSIKDVAASLRVTATAPDGIIEAVERPGATFCLGVQWHPENFLNHDEFAPLFRAFVEAAMAAASATADQALSNRATADRARSPR